jgi:hypothetical protein
VNGHANDVLTDNGDGTFAREKGDMRSAGVGSAKPDDLSQSYQSQAASSDKLSQPLEGKSIDSDNKRLTAN